MNRVRFTGLRGSGFPAFRWSFMMIGLLVSLFIQLLPSCANVVYASETVGTMEAELELLADSLPIWSGIPFVGILLSIALLPMLTPHFWHFHYKKISLMWALVLAIPFLVVYRNVALHELTNVILHDYLPFIILLWGLYTVSGGIFIKGTLAGTPLVNTQVLIFGTFLASIMGTTGASMLLIRPLLRSNRHRSKKSHIFIFFIFLISNIGGLLTPLGDPPLFLGFLHGVPFFWTLKLFPEFLVVAAVVLTIFYFLDNYFYKTDVGAIEHAGTKVNATKLTLEGPVNIIFLIGILTAVMISGVWEPGGFGLLGIKFEWQGLARDAFIVVMGLLSLKFTAKQIHRENDFGWHAIKEVAWLFFGIFVTIIPVIMMLKVGVHGHLGFLVAKVTEAWHYFWMSGALSSFLDNAPTYLSFFNMALGQTGLNEAEAAAILRGTLEHPQAQNYIDFLKAVSCGAVFMGAITYIGNAPNFMVKTICSEYGVKMPSFFGYMLWSFAILIPSFIIVTLIFF